ncbi:MAG: aminotransferase class V-fold PLP-dependent enzyme [Clostridia bacterium]|nr:aminotransferase class V-fold PLP-dependent enzyme [Clostridia bacterium]
MSNTPICDFVKEYARKKPLRFHMPGHKGRKILGCEPLDLTEIEGADSLFEASGIIAESERNASALFGCPTFYSTEGSSLCVRAMLYLASTRGRGKTVLAARNVHKSFLYAAALLDFDVRWLYPDDGSYLSNAFSPHSVAAALDGAEEKPCCVFLTSPDYLGGVCDVKEIARVCHERGVLLLVDCAHGAYLRFPAQASVFPTDLGADLVCSSAHKTLPVLTGGAYLHIGNGVKEEFRPRAKDALALFASTSPSYLILQSLDAANARLKTLGSKWAPFCLDLFSVSNRLHAAGYGILAPARFTDGTMTGKTDPEKDLCAADYGKLTVKPKSRGYTGDELAAILEDRAIYPEFHDPDHIVFMTSPLNGKKDLKALERALLSIPCRAPIRESAPPLPRPERVMSVREALFSPSERLPASECRGRVLHDPSVSCPPAVPVLMCGERIDGQAIECFEYYGVKEVAVVREFGIRNL